MVAPGPGSAIVMLAGHDGCRHRCHPAAQDATVSRPDETLSSLSGQLHGTWHGFRISAQGRNFHGGSRSSEITHRLMFPWHGEALCDGHGVEGGMSAWRRRDTGDMTTLDELLAQKETPEGR